MLSTENSKIMKLLQHKNPIVNAISETKSKDYKYRQKFAKIYANGVEAKKPSAFG